MISLIMQCARCREVVELASGMRCWAEAKHPESWSYITTRLGRLDLCDQCTKKLEKWIEAEAA